MEEKRNNRVGRAQAEGRAEERPRPHPGRPHLAFRPARDVAPAHPHRRARNRPRRTCPHLPGHRPRPRPVLGGAARAARARGPAPQERHAPPDDPHPDRGRALHPQPEARAPLRARAALRPAPSRCWPTRRSPTARTSPSSAASRSSRREPVAHRRSSPNSVQPYRRGGGRASTRSRRTSRTRRWTRPWSSVEAVAKTARTARSAARTTAGGVAAAGAAAGALAARARRDAASGPSRLQPTAATLHDERAPKTRIDGRAPARLEESGEARAVGRAENGETTTMASPRGAAVGAAAGAARCGPRRRARAAARARRARIRRGGPGRRSGNGDDAGRRRASNGAGTREDHSAAVRA